MRNEALDLIKGFACIGVVFIHIRFPGLCGHIVQRIAQMAVPLFFMISGYFFYKPNVNESIKSIPNKIKRTLTLLAEAVVVYGLLRLITGELATKEFTLGKFVSFVLFNDFEDIWLALWYILAMLYTYFLMKFILKLPERGIKLEYIMFSLLICRIICLMFSNNWHYSSNFALCGIPYFLVGYCIAKNTHKKFNKNATILIIPVGIIMNGLFSSIGFLVSNLANNIILRLFIEIGTMISSIAIFYIAVQVTYQSKKLKPVVILGRKYSAMVYIYHGLFISVVNLLFTGNSNVIIWIKPILVVILSIIWAIIRLFIKNCIMNKIHNQN